MATFVMNSDCDRAQQALATSAIWVLRQLRVEEEGKDLVLTGRVHSYYQKQMAQEIVRSAVAGVPLVNRVDVDS